MATVLPLSCGVVALMPVVANEAPQLTHMTWFGLVATPQLGQKFFSVRGLKPHLGQATALSLTSVPQFLQYIILVLVF